MRQDHPIADGDLVILVHGTYAAANSDEGKAWWQAGSEAAKGLHERLRAGVKVAQAGEVFHWSGENSERARIKGSQELLEYMTRLEKCGHKYHLVGHSHGGSVIWHALRAAALKGVKLGQLRSWTTVGTPFLHHRTHNLSSVVTWFNLLLAAVLFKPAFTVVYRLVKILAFGEVPIADIASASGTANPSLYKTPILFLMNFFGEPFQLTSAGFRIGSFDSARGDSIVRFLFLSIEGWVLLALAAFIVFVYLNLASLFLRPALESLYMHSESRLIRNARDTFGSRWLGLWSLEDEAVNGLRATLDLSLKIVSRMTPRDRVLFSDRLSLISAPYYWVVTPIFNAIVRPMLDRMIRSFLVKSAQGNNRPAAEVVQVTPTPWDADLGRGAPSLPDWLDARIVRVANESARDLAPKLRQLLALPSFVSGLEGLGKTISGRELVHTSYFDHPEILDLIAMHITWASGEPNWARDVLGRNRTLVAWLQEAKRYTGTELYLPSVEHIHRHRAQKLLSSLRQTA